MKVEYCYFDNKKLEAVAKACVEPCLPILPFWVHSVVVQCKGELDRGGSDTVVKATVTCEPAYRYVVIELYLSFWDMAEEKQLESILHEIIHTLLEPILGWVRSRVFPQVKANNEELAEMFRGEFMDKSEAVVQDMCFALKPLLGIQEDIKP